MVDVLLIALFKCDWASLKRLVMYTIDLIKAARQFSSCVSNCRACKPDVNSYSAKLRNCRLFILFDYLISILDQYLLLITNSQLSLCIQEPMDTMSKPTGSVV